MQKKLKDLYAPADLVRMQTQTAGKMQQAGMGGMMGMPTGPDQHQAGVRMRRELENFARESAKGQENLVKLIANREAIVGRLAKREKELVASGRDDLKTKQELVRIQEVIGRIEENNAQKRESRKLRDTILNQALEARQKMNVSPERLMSAYRAGGFGGALREGGSMIGQMSGGQRAGLAGSVMGAMGTALGIGGEMYGNYTGSPLRTAGNVGAGTQSTLGVDTQNIYSRRSAFEAAFNPERSRAARMALEANRGARIQSGTGLVGNMLGYAGAGMGAGAAIGSVVPGLGTGVGAAIGGAAGAVKGAYNVFSDPAQRSLAMSALPGSIGKRYGTEYESIQTRKLGEDYQKSLEDLKNQNPGKTMASQYYEQNYQGNLASQRAMGMSNQGFYGQGGFLQGGVNAGFGPEMMQNMSSGILGAGGSSRSAAGNSVFGNQLAKNMDLTNSQQVLGTLSGSMGGAETTKQATVKIISEAMRLGLDDSKFAEENRRFTQAAAEVIARSGAQTEGDAGRVAGGFGAFVAENSNKGIEAAKGAYEQYQQISSTTTGPRGVMRAAGFLSDPALSKLSTVEQQSLMGMREDEINENNLQAVAIADKLGISVDDLKDKIKGTNQGAVSRYKAHDEARDRLKQKGISIADIKSSKDFAALDDQSKKDIRDMGGFESAENSFANPREARAFMAGQLGQQTPADIQMDRDKVAASKAQGSGGRQEDLTNADAAKDFGIVLNNFRDFRKDIIPTAEAIEKFTGKIREMMIALNSASSDIDKSNIIKYYAKSRAETQGQSGKNSK